MRLTRIKTAIAAGVAVLAGGIAWAAGPQSGRMAMPEAVVAMLQDLPAAAKSMPAQSPVREAVDAGKLDDARAMLEFQPYDEAPLPKGFPSYTPVGVIEVKEYPAYRKADGPSFWPLFQHIQKEGIPMTAPVEMAKPTWGPGKMAFLYQSTEVGATGEAEGVKGVTVRDEEPTTAVSIGVRGTMSKQAVSEARRRLEAWVEASPEFHVAGDDAFRLFGYNSPGIPGRDKYWEAQIVLSSKSPPAE